MTKTNRDRLIMNLKDICPYTLRGTPDAEKACNLIADFIMERDKRIEPLIKALESLIDDEPCSFDHHGYCQTHFSGSSPCIMEEARKALKNAGL